MITLSRILLAAMIVALVVGIAFPEWEGSRYSLILSASSAIGFNFTHMWRF